MPWSFSKLSTYERCPAQKHYKYDLKMGSKEVPPAVQRGIRIHGMIEGYLKGTDTLTLELITFQELFDKIRKKKPLIEEKITIDDKWQTVPRETSWAIGILDCCYTGRGKVEIQEWKTGGVYEHHDDQRALYLLLAKARWPEAKSYRIRTYYFDKGKHIDMSLEEKLVEPMQKDFSTRVQIMTADDIHAPRPGPHCHWCEFAKSKGGICPMG